MFSGIPFDIEFGLDVDDKANSAGVAVDAIRYCKIAMDSEVRGPYQLQALKHPPQPMSDAQAK